MSTQRIHHVDPALVAICGGALTALLALFPLNFSIISFLLTYFAALPLYFVGLSWGLSRLMLAGAVAIGIFTIGAGLHASLAFILTTFIPALLIVFRVQKGDPAGYIVSWVTGLSITVFLGVTLVLSSQSINIMDVLQSWFSLFADESSLKGMSGQIIPLLPGLSSISWIMMCLVNASMAARLVARAQLGQRPYPVPTDTQFYENWDIILVLSLLLILTADPLFAFIGKNMALMSCAPIFLVGLKAVYTWFKQFNNPKLWMVVLVFMSIFLVWPGIIIVMFGVLEPTLHLRQRWAPNKEVDK
ncbi:MAG: hypothetical protein ACOH2E_05260 [Candidatus Paracaedibacter sp.]|jgi:hypothetical protein